jgi:hypothetical protein
VAEVVGGIDKSVKIRVFEKNPETHCLFMGWTTNHGMGHLTVTKVNKRIEP